MNNWFFVNGEFISEEKAVLNVNDLSIQRGYGIFDFFKVVNGAPVFLDEHLERFYASAKEMRLVIDYSKDELSKIIFELLQKNNIDNTGVRITLTGGYSTDDYQLFKPNLIISLRSFAPQTKEQFEKGIKLVTYEHQRQLPHVKTIDYLMSIYLQPFIKQNNADDLLYHKNGVVSECPRSNFFIVTHDNKIVTPSKNILKGVMRMKVIDVAKKQFEVEEREITIEEIKTARESFITSTTKNILPVHRLDDYFFPKQNPVTVQLFQSLAKLQPLNRTLFDNSF
jgi:branched-chain amino acid aminotransferase